MTSSLFFKRLAMAAAKLNAHDTGINTDQNTDNKSLDSTLDSTLDSKLSPSQSSASTHITAIKNKTSKSKSAKTAANRQHKKATQSKAMHSKSMQSKIIQSKTAQSKFKQQNIKPNIQSALAEEIEYMGNHIAQIIGAKLDNETGNLHNALVNQHEEFAKSAFDRISAMEYRLSEISERLSMIQGTGPRLAPIARRHELRHEFGSIMPAPHHELMPVQNTAQNTVSKTAPGTMSGTQANSAITLAQKQEIEKLKTKSALDVMNESYVTNLEHKIIEKLKGLKTRDAESTHKILERITAAETFLIRAGMENMLPRDKEIALLRRLTELRKIVKQKVQKANDAFPSQNTSNAQNPSIAK